MTREAEPAVHLEFTAIPEHYDALMSNVPYRLWVGYIQEILKRFSYAPQSVLDVACGTGTVCEYLAQLGYEVTGVDVSEGMIKVAKRKARLCGSNVSYHVQDAADLSLGRQFDLAISLFDSLNYITVEARLKRALHRIAEHVTSGGYLIFDVNTEYALSHGFFNQANLEADKYPKYIWRSDYDYQSRVCKVTMVFEVMEKGKRRQFTEIHYQKAYRLDELDSMLSAAGFETAAKYQAYRFRQPTRRSDRVYFVARKR